MTSDLSLIIAFTLVGLLLAILVWLLVARRHLQRAYSQLQQQFQQQGFNHQASLDQQKFETQLSQQQQQQLNSQLTELAQAHQSLQSKFSELQTNYQQILTENQVLQASQLEERKAQQEKLQLLSESKQSLKLEFENLANQLLDKKSASLKAKQEEFFAQSLLPLREQLQEFRTRIDKVYESESRDRLNLVNELHQLKALNQKMSDDAINLTNALKGSQKFQGNWGELILERVLESSGLRNGYEYELQASRKGVDGKTYLPDVIVQLPDDKQLIIDAKVSLLDYQRYIEADDSAEKKLA
ncbi:MAG: DNA recombination protein RmuC, partial [Pseudomonadales bacterium]|nr:DNA recombination protein RmuC [Pseudomonadales bacterium]